MIAALALLAAAHAWDDPNRMPSIHLAVVHAFGAEKPWGARLGGSWMFALGDHCGYQETSCRRGVVWPVAAPAVSFTWRGGPRFIVEVGGEFSVAGLEMYHFGFAPIWGLGGRAGLRLDFDGMIPGLALGGFGSKSFGVTVPTGENSYTTYGAHGIGLRVDVDTAWLFEAGSLGDPAFAPPTLAVGTWIVLGGARTLD